MNTSLVRSRQFARRGFTLLEMMLVVMIMGVLIGVATWNIIGQGEKARRAATIATMHNVEGMLNTYNLDNTSFPSTLYPLIPKYTSKMPVDAWKRPIVYVLNQPGGPHPFNLYSYGSTGDPSDPSAIDYWAEDQAGTPAH